MGHPAHLSRRPAQPSPTPPVFPFLPLQKQTMPWRPSTAPWPRWRPSAPHPAYLADPGAPFSPWNPNPYPLAPPLPLASPPRRPTLSSLFFSHRHGDRRPRASPTPPRAPTFSAPSSPTISRSWEAPLRAFFSAPFRLCHRRSSSSPTNPAATNPSRAFLGRSVSSSLPPFLLPAAAFVPS